MIVKNPLLRYHGSKWQIANWLIERFPPHYTYVEPFGGGAAVLLSKSASKAEVYNDLDSEMTNLFTVVRDHQDELLRRLFYTPFSRDAYHEAFERARDPEGIADPIERARITLTVSYQALCSAGVTRKSRPGWRSWAKPGWGQTPAEYWALLDERVIPVAERLRGVYIENRPGLDIIRQYDGPETFFYCDPPYIATTRKEGLGAYRHEMTEDEHEQLIETLLSVQGKVILSGYDCPLYDRYLKGWRKEWTSSKTEGQNTVKEFIWVSPSTTRDQISLFEAA